MNGTTDQREESVTSRRHRLLADPSRVQIMAVLQAAGRPVAARDIGQLIQLHPTTARFHLEQLADAGLVERTTEVRHTRGRPRVLYSPVAIQGCPFAGLADLFPGVRCRLRPPPSLPS